MWRAWGILLALLAQDPVPPYSDADNEFSLRPPSGWTGRECVPPTVVKFGPAGKPAEISVIHHHSPNPTPLKSYVEQEEKRIAAKFEGAAADKKEFTLSGRPAAQFSFMSKELIHLETLVCRTNIEYYILNAVYPASEAAAVRPAVDEAIASFRIVPAPLTADERAAEARGAAVLRSAKVLPELLGEQWHAIYAGEKKFGHQRTKLSDSGGRYVLEVDVAVDYGNGGNDKTVLRGSFSPDGRSQKIDVEQTKTHKDERWQFRARAEIEDGQARAAREMNGFKEEIIFKVGEGVLFNDVAEVFRRVLLGAGKGVYLIHTLSPYSDEPVAEIVEVNDRDRVELDGRKLEAQVVFVRPGRRRNLICHYAVDRTLLRMGGARDLFSLRVVTKEEALKP